MTTQRQSKITSIQQRHLARQDADVIRPLTDEMAVFAQNSVACISVRRRAAEMRVNKETNDFGKRFLLTIRMRAGSRKSFIRCALPDSAATSFPTSWLDQVP